jgi:hypothetical protein
MLEKVKKNILKIFKKRERLNKLKKFLRNFITFIIFLT